MFLYIVISPAGTPIFQYPLEGSKELEETEIAVDSILFGGLMSALDTYSKQATGNDLGEVTFGSIITSFSKDDFGNMHVVLSNAQVNINLNKQYHIEAKSLLLMNAERIGLMLDPDKQIRAEWQFDSIQVQMIFEPFYKDWLKRLKR